MTKESGLGAGFWVDQYAISGDINSLQRISGSRANTDVTGIDKSAFERILTAKDGAIEYTAYFNKASGRAHPVLSSLPTTDRVCTYGHRQTTGAPAACMVGKQINYDPNRNADASLTFAVSAQANGYGLEWGRLLTDGAASLTGAANGTGISKAVGTDTLYFPGAVSTSTATTPDAAALDVTGDIDIRALVALDDWTPAAETTVLAKYTTTGNQRSYGLIVNTSGLLGIIWSEDGTAQKSKTSSVATGFTDGSKHWIRVTMDVDNGAGDANIRFYTSEDGTTWTQLGTTQTNGATTSIFASTALLEIGGRSLSTTNRLIGKFYEGVVLSGITAGTEVAHPLASSSGITDSTGKTWTVGASVIQTLDNNYGLQMYGHVIGFTGTDATIKVQHSYDNGVSDAWSDVSGASVAVTAVGSFRVATASTVPIKRYTRTAVTTSGGFTSLQYVHAVVVNEAAVTF